MRGNALERASGRMSMPRKEVQAILGWTFRMAQVKDRRLDTENVNQGSTIRSWQTLSSSKEEAATP